MDIVFFALPLVLVAAAYLRSDPGSVDELTQCYGVSRTAASGCPAGR